MNSLINKEELKKKLIRFIENQNNNKLNELKDILEETKNCTEDYPTSPGKPNLNNIKSKGETAFQRGIFNGKNSLLSYRRKNSNKKVNWLDLELPVTLNKNSRRRSLDLIGLMGDLPVLCELKYFENSSSDHPIYAIVELLMYYYFIQCNNKKLDKHNVHHLGFENFKWEIIINNETQLLIVANKKYWDYWYKKISKEELLKLTLSLNRDLNVNIHLFETQDEDYTKQKEVKISYNPTISSNIWTKIE